MKTLLIWLAVAAAVVHFANTAAETAAAHNAEQQQIISELMGK